MTAITYQVNRAIPVDELASVFRASGIRRPVDDPQRLESMLKHANLLVTAWHGEQLIGVARALTDYAWCCYLSDLAVDKAWQRQGIGQALIERVRQETGTQPMLLLLAAPEAMEYYPAIGFNEVKNGWIIPRGE